MYTYFRLDELQSGLKQIIKIIPRDIFNELVIRCKSDRYYKTFFSWEQLVTICSLASFPAVIQWAKYVMVYGHWPAS